MENTAEITFNCPFCNAEIVEQAPVMVNIVMLSDSKRTFSLLAAKTVDYHECL
jgi:transcription elongation factor Elf1